MSRVRNRADSDHEDILNRVDNRKNPIHPDATHSVDEGDEGSDGSTKTIGLSFWVFSTVVVFAIMLWVCNIHNTCPEVNDASSAGVICGNACFVGDHARLHLQKVTELGPRTAGSVSNEILAASYLREELIDITAIALESGLEAEWDEQISDYSEYRTQHHVATYTNVRNLMLRIRDPRGSAAGTSNTSAFLVNCHYDSGVGSPGASDAFVSCAIMLEIGRIITENRWSLSNDLILLFNGAEENVLPGSHAFITQHRWARDVAAFLNLEGAGAGGRLMVFQTGPGKAAELLVGAYAQSFRQPFANVVGEVLFQSGLIPSDTDYRIFRDFGRIPGLDMAYTSDGYAYHTPFDTESRVTQTCLKGSGQDIIRFIKRILSDERLPQLHKLELTANDTMSDLQLNELSSNDVPFSMCPGPKVAMEIVNRFVYFDVLGMIFVSVSWPVWKCFTWLLVASTVAWIVGGRNGRWLGLLCAIVLQIVSHVLGVGFAYLVGTLTHHFGSRMSWFSFRYNVVGVFLLPNLWWFCWFFTFLFRIPDGLAFRCGALLKLCSKAKWVSNNNKIVYASVERDFFDASLAVLLIPSTLLVSWNNLSVFVFALLVANMLLGRVLHHYAVWTRFNLSSSTLSLLTVIPSLFWYTYFCATLLTFFIPVTGRTGDVLKPDVAVSLCLFLLATPLTLMVSGLLICTSVRSGRILRFVLLNICVSYAILVHSSPFGFPYSSSPSSKLLDSHVSPRYQRVILLHTHRLFREMPNQDAVTRSDSYVLVVPLDTNGARYLKPNSYPRFPPSSMLATLRRGSDDLNDPFPGAGIPELSNMRPTYCDRSLPYCGTAAIYPYIHFFKGFYHIPAEPHGAAPGASLKLLHQNTVSAPGGRVAHNLTFAISSGPPTVNLLIRTAVPHIRLSDWSFLLDAAHPVPMPLPHFAADEDAHDSGAHYVITHLNAALVGGTNNYQSSSSSAPLIGDWTFWLVFDQRQEDIGQFNHVDLAVAGLYLDDRLPSSSSAALKRVLSQLPPWASAVSGCTTYHHWRFNLSHY